MRKILFVEDNDAYRELVTKELQKHNYRVDAVDSPITGLEYLARQNYDLVISDLKLPVMSGVQFTESVKNISPNTICIILTGDPDESSEIASIESNISLYLEKNRSLSVIIRYIEKLLESEQKGASHIITSQEEKIIMQVKERLVYKNEEVIDLTNTEFEILRLLLSNKNSIISRENFINEIWKKEVTEDNKRHVDTHIKKLRHKLNTYSIMTVRGYGYKWNEYE